MSDMLEIRKGGILIDIYWDGESRSYKEEDVTKSALKRLWDPCRLAEGVTLRDVFLVLNTQLDSFDSIITNWCKDIVTEGLSNPVPIPTDEPEDKKMEYLELYWSFECSRFDQDKWSMGGTCHPEFHGVGVELTKDVDELGGHKKGERIPWGLSFRKANELAAYPIKLADRLTILTTEYTRKTRNTADKLTEFPAAEYTLGNILYGIIWELSFFGSPQMRDKKSSELLQSAEDVKAGRVKLTPWESVFPDEDDDKSSGA